MSAAGEASAVLRDPAPPRLHSLSGRAATPQLLRVWRLVGAWPAPALGEVWMFLGPLAEDPRASRAMELMRGFCQRHEMGRAEVGEAGSVLHNLLVNAASLDLAAGGFAEDLAALGGGPAVAVLLAGYPQAVRAIRMRMLKSALADHGKLLTEIAWRSDVIGDSDAARGLASSVLVLTLGWQEGEAKGRTTLQLTPDKIVELRRVLASLGG